MVLSQSAKAIVWSSSAMTSRGSAPSYDERCECTHAGSNGGLFVLVQVEG